MQSDSSFVQRILVKLLVGSFVAEIAVAEVWLRIERGSSVIYLLGDDRNLPVALATGISLAVIAAPLTWLYFNRFGRSIVEDFLLPIFSGVNGRDIALLAILPGIGEECLFRGAIQPSLGLVAASLIFGLMHTGFSRRLLPYAVWTTTIGALLGAVFLLTGNLWGSIVAHGLINASSVLWMKRLIKAR